jgi:putative DNA primase/helicase
MSVSIVKRFFPHFTTPIGGAAPMPHTRVRQITDRPMSAAMLIANEYVSKRSKIAQENNVARIRRLIEVRAREVAPGRMLVICQLGLEQLLLDTHALPHNVDLAHFAAVAGENRWRDVALLMVIGRTEPTPRDVERIARPLFGVVVAELNPDVRGAVRWPLAKRGIRMRNGRGVEVQGSYHPDSLAEEIRWQICEAQLVQAIGRGRGASRTASDPLQIDILTNVVLPLEVDEATTWDAMQPTVAKVMWARGAVPLSYRDMAECYPDLFESGEAARKALSRENPGQMST